ncbi:hypothetical protein CANCADRAFT_11312, partial [Tortispora caseinolytica NRRL Y-17796]
DILTKEILDFVEYISPTEEDIAVRERIIKDVKDCVKELWPSATVQVFGSYGAGLYLPESDIDLVVFMHQTKLKRGSWLKTLANALTKKGNCKSINVISHARVPIIKFVDKQSHIPVDVSLDINSGVSSTAVVKEWIRITPGLRHLTIVMKTLLRQRGLNEVYQGGLGSFSLLCMMMAFLRQHPLYQKGKIDPMENLGVLLIEFCELYGIKFNYNATSIACHSSGAVAFTPKKYEISNIEYVSRGKGNNMPSRLVIRDPLDIHNNVARSSHKMIYVEYFFRELYNVLSIRC